MKGKKNFLYKFTVEFHKQNQRCPIREGKW